MTRKSRPHAGSIAFYPRKRASRETPSFRSFPSIDSGKEGNAKPINFLGYKAGMTHVLGRDAHSKGATYGQEIAIPVTVIEVPPLKVFGIRAYGEAEAGYGTAALMDIFADKIDKELLRKLQNFKKKRSKKEKKAKESKARTLHDLESAKERISSIALLVHSQPWLCGFGKKKPDVMEVILAGSIGQQLAYAKEMLGKDIAASDVFAEHEFLDVNAVTKGKGMQGVIKRFGVRMHRPKAKKRRVVGSIGPWNPSTVMWTVARPGQMGYHTRTELNKKVLKMGQNGNEVNPSSGFKNYGMVKSAFIVLGGSVAGPAKRAIAMRRCVRPPTKERHKVEGIDFIATKALEKAGMPEVEEKLLQKAEVQKEEKKEKKSVQEEIAEAVKGEKK